MYEDQEQASEKLYFELATNSEPEARLLALTSLDKIGYLENDTLIQILNEDKDPRVMLQTIDYLIKRVGTDHRIEEVLSAFFDSHNEMNNS
mgnify:FL=1